MAVPEEKAKQLMDSAELTIIEAMGPKEFLEKHNLKKIGKYEFGIGWGNITVDYMTGLPID